MPLLLKIFGKGYTRANKKRGYTLMPNVDLLDENNFPEELKGIFYKLKEKQL
ncbi:hypothetical protein DSOL_4733 [Desulfosporosinus metallidurans]|uniref:Uncharacterized protein n=1 Tax=Desulfosporosinus metallidurans TaxID=1888891 RepID=A0A1Q8QIC2_9FIRM|nr:hypothetical protein DSOL_4733 [Desulfosporosinus metallidurans]